MDEQKNKLLRDIPRIDELLEHLRARGFMDRVARETLKEICRQLIGNLRSKILLASDTEVYLPLIKFEAVAGNGLQIFQLPGWNDAEHAAIAIKTSVRHEV